MGHTAHPMARADRTYRIFCLIAAATFALVAAYTVSVKIPAGELSSDWMHTALHIASGLLALLASARRSATLLSRVFTIGLIGVYGVLGIVGWFIDGVALHTAFRVPLHPADNFFHLLLAGAGTATVILARRHGRPHGAANPA